MRRACPENEPGTNRSVEPKDQILWKRERLMPKQFSDFIGQNRAKARLELAIAAAKSGGEALSHVLLIGSPGLGTATLAHIVAKAMGVNLKSTCGYAIQKAGNLAGLFTNTKPATCCSLTKSIDCEWTSRNISTRR